VQVLNQFYIKSVVRKALQEDLKPKGDVTTNFLGAKNKIIKARIIAKQDGVIAGLEFCKTAFKLIGRETIFTKKIFSASYRASIYCPFYVLQHIRIWRRLLQPLV